MKSQQSSQKSFPTIEAILVVIAIALVGFTGWYVWHSKHDGTVRLKSVAAGPITWDKLPQGLLFAIDDQWPAGCTQGSDSIDNQLNQANRIIISGSSYAKVSLSCTKNFTYPTEIFVNTAGFWQYLGNFDFNYGCEKAKLFDIPKQIVGSKCTDKYGKVHRVV